MRNTIYMRYYLFITINNKNIISKKYHEKTFTLIYPIGLVG